jgi:non-heme chloroperoxidase
MTTTNPPAPITDHERTQIGRANATGRQPVVFVHGLWLLPSSWDRWGAVFDEAGYTSLTPGWRMIRRLVDEANAHPDVFAEKTVGQVADHFERVIRRLNAKPAVIGHSFGGLLAQILAGRGLSAATVAIDPAPFRGVLPLPFSAKRSAWPVLGNPANRHRAVPLTFDQFRFGFANTVDTENPERGPLLILSGERDHTVSSAIANASFKRQLSNPGVTEIVEIPNRGHALTIDSGWRDVANTALAFVKRFV